MITLPFDAVPGTSKLFNDYCNNSPEAKKYFIGHFSDLLAYETHIQFLEQRKYFRAETAAVLERQNAIYGSGPAAMAHIASLRERNTFTVVTGQQVGLFLGPLYTVYKALTAVHLAGWLKDQFPSHNFIPLFWLETEDHDLEEANEAGFLTKTNDYTLIRNGEPNPEEKNLHPVGALRLGETIGATIESLQELLQRSDFTADMLATVGKYYSAGETYGTAFPKLFNGLFGDTGLVFVDPSDAALKQFLSPVLLREIETFPVTSEEVISRSAELEDHYHAQVKPRAINLFFSHNDKRHPIEPAEYDFFLRGSRKRLSREELISSAEQHPELFSANVLLRPIFQDYLFPTAAYVAGPSEIAYFAQLGPVYDHFQIPMPIIFPRASITVVERKAAAVLEKYNLPYVSMFGQEDDILRDIFSQSADEVSALDEFDGIRRRLEDSLSSLYEFARGIDQNLKGPAEATIANIRKSLSNFEEKLFQAKKQQDEVTRRQIRKLLIHLCPEGKPQERMVNLLSFYNKYGERFLQGIDEMCVPFPAEHRILFL